MPPGIMELAAAVLSGGGLVALGRAWLEHRRRRADAPEGARVIVEGAAAGVAMLQGVLATMRDELEQRDKRIDGLEADLAAKEQELIKLRARVAGLEVELHAYKGAHL